ncbi:unnamed protein product [Linum trigynum]|uniref:Uncharacterized protein n=1 Tax=Linum trigynum TaxID=586398 RepID=A0AAV2ETS5_9ROSI
MQSSRSGRINRREKEPPHAIASGKINPRGKNRRMQSPLEKSTPVGRTVAMEVDYNLEEIVWPEKKEDR